MLKYKTTRTKGKISLSMYFQKFEKGDPVTVVRELSIPLDYPKKIQGRTGRILSKRGSAYYVEIKDLNKPKRYIIKPVHLRKIKETK
jgi:large subunit ribosomal protein L21e